MEAGLTLGFAEARRSKGGFSGTTRVMLFTDERPNVGRTDAGSFMSMARAASRDGIGLSTIGVSTHFGAELAQQISSVRGGNLFFFPDVMKMKDVFEDELDTMVTELAYDMALVVQPGKHTKIAGVYGVPGDLLTWQKSGAIELTVETIFASKNKGAIYVAFAPDGDKHLPQAQIESGQPIGAVGVSYLNRDGKREKSGAAFDLKPKSAASLGLVRGSLLVDQATSMKKAASLHLEHNDQEGAYRIVHALATRYKHSVDPDLAEERTTVMAMLDTLARLSGHLGEGGSSGTLLRDQVTGLPPRPASAP
jgi:Ca-activated chloride channel family protein